MSQGELLTDQATLDRYLDALVVRYGGEARNLAALTRLLGGAYPTEVLAAHTRVIGTGRGSGGSRGLGTDRGQDDAAGRRGVGPPTPGEGVPPTLTVGHSRLPVPHPLDFEWWFSVGGCETLARLVTQGGNQWDLALLGTPRLAEYLASEPEPRGSTLFELRPEACAALERLRGVEVIPGDVGLTAVGYRGRFRAVIADPPWYLATLDGFVKAAAVLLEPAGEFFLCVPGLTTRPGVARERAAIADAAAEAGLLLQDVWSGRVEYESPPFELSALSAAGLAAFDPYWRRGDVLHFKQVPAVATAARAVRSLAMPPTAAAWAEVPVGRARFRVAPGVDRRGQPLLESVLPGDVLESVSTRDPRRSLASVWTTTNRIYRTGRPNELIKRLQKLSTQLPIGATPDGDSITRAVIAEIDDLRSLGVE